jgi:UDP-N-acetylmuramyl pentapeptide synthase
MPLVRAEFATAPGGWHVRISAIPDVGETDFFMPECPDGMLRNAALAAVAALLAGASQESVRAATARWRPSPRRGEIIQKDGKLIYVDCYNANPASMLDAARAFERRTAAVASGRLFVLGGMGELGAQSVALHESTGRDLPLRRGDALLLFGGDSAAFGRGAVSAGFPEEAVRQVVEIDELCALVAAFSGPVFLKGSRAHALERVLS